LFFRPFPPLGNGDAGERTVLKPPSVSAGNGDESGMVLPGPSPLGRTDGKQYRHRLKGRNISVRSSRAPAALLLAHGEGGHAAVPGWCHPGNGGGVTGRRPPACRRDSQIRCAWSAVKLRVNPANAPGVRRSHTSSSVFAQKVFAPGHDNRRVSWQGPATASRLSTSAQKQRSGRDP
jgi:hypothetical protein